MYTILLVDDDAHVREAYARELRQNGYAVVLDDGLFKDVLESVQTVRPDLVMLDIKLGEASGLDLLQKIRACHPVLPIVLCTAYDAFRFDMKAVAADGYVVKSSDTAELLQVVAGLLPEKDG